MSPFEQWELKKKMVKRFFSELDFLELVEISSLLQDALDNKAEELEMTKEKAMSLLDDYETNRENKGQTQDWFIEFMEAQFKGGF